MLIDGAWVDEPARVKVEIYRFFQQRFQELESIRPQLNGVSFKSINQQQNQLLVGCFSEEEIKRAVWECGNEKSPGPDGLNFKFIKQFWQLLKPEITRFIFEFHANGIFPKGSNASFITLVPKVPDPQNLNDFRPISLIGCVYKIVAKLLSNRLKRVMPDIWKLKIPSKSLVFAWRLIRDRLPTRMNLRRRQVVINEVQCPFCGDVEEEAAHLFFSCKRSYPYGGSLYLGLE